MSYLSQLPSILAASQIAQVLFYAFPGGHPMVHNILLNFLNVPFSSVHTETNEQTGKHIYVCTNMTLQ